MRELEKDEPGSPTELSTSSETILLHVLLSCTSSGSPDTEDSKEDSRRFLKSAQSKLWQYLTREKRRK
jgi:hypothetical protein